MAKAEGSDAEVLSIRFQDFLQGSEGEEKEF